jgi:hypothetical protein
MSRGFLPLFENVVNTTTYPDPNTLGYGAVTTNTTTDKITTASANNLVTGDVFRVATTAGGLTAGVNYFVYKPTGYANTEISAATTVANALAGSIIDLTASVGNILYYDPKYSEGRRLVGTAFATDINKRIICPIHSLTSVTEVPVNISVEGSFTSVTLNVWFYNAYSNRWVRPTQNTPSYTLTENSFLYISNTQQMQVYLGVSALTGTNVSVYVNSCTASVG